jgi:hypothetical protein
MERDDRPLGWLLRQWQYAGFLTGIVLLLLLPLWASETGLVLALIYLQLPLYMLHQLEEHAGDRFRRFVNDRMAGGRDALTPRATLVINVVDLIALYLSFFVDPGFGLIALYLSVVNAIVHLVATVALRAYNPGLWTAILLFLPLGAWSLYVLTSAGAGFGTHALGLIVAVAIHAMILAHVRRRIGKMSVCPS